MNKLYALVMAGGRGTRFWPESTSKKPKQYLSLLGGDDSLLAKTLSRFEGLIDAQDRYVVTVKEQEELAKGNSGNMIGERGVIFEPAGRNTAPCILLSIASLVANGASENDVAAIVPSDHVILNEKGFRDVIADAGKVAAEKGEIVTIGIPPNFPHTGFGYLHRGEECDGVYVVKQFKEKPDFETAQEYLKSGEYYWNAGMFVASIGTLLREFKEHAPEMFDHYEDLVAAANDFDKVAEIYGKLPKESIDYAIMEKSSHVSVIPARFDWNDLGSWDALESVIDKKDENVIVSCDGHYFDGAKENIVYAPNKFVSLINVNDLIVVSNEDSLVVLPKKDSQKVKSIVEFLKDHPLGEKLL